MSKDKDHYYIYVIELSPAVVKNRRFTKENRGFNPFLPCYYVGMTGLTPEKRFENHKNGYKSNYFAHKYGVRLVPKIYRRYNPMSYKKAAEREVLLANALRHRGHGVWQN